MASARLPREGRAEATPYVTVVDLGDLRDYPKTLRNDLEALNYDLEALNYDLKELAYYRKTLAY